MSVGGGTAGVAPAGAGPSSPVPRPDGATAPGRKRSRARWAALAAAVAVVVVVAALALGAVPGVSLFGSMGSGNGISSYTAESRAAGLASAHEAGALVAIVGIAPMTSFPFGQLQGNATCSVADPLASNVTVPAETGGYAGGKADFWLLAYFNSVGRSASAIAVIAGTAYFLGNVSGSSCLGSLTVPSLPDSYIDSVQAADAFNADAGAFLAGHAAANAVYALVDNATFGPVWLVLYTNCSYDPVTNTTTGGSTALLSGVVDGSDGSLLLGGYTSSFSCTVEGILNYATNLTSLALPLATHLGAAEVGPGASTVFAVPGRAPLPIG